MVQYWYMCIDVLTLNLIQIKFISMEEESAPVDDLANYLRQSEPIESEMAQDATEYEFRNLSFVFFQTQLLLQTLMSYGFPMIGDLRGIHRNELDKTNACLKAILAQRQRDIDYRKNIDGRLKNFEEENTNLLNKLRALEQKVTEKDKMIDTLRVQLEGSEERHKKERDRLVNEKEDLVKKYSHIQTQQSQYLNEIRKKDNELKRLQDQVLFWQQASIQTKGDKAIKYKNGMEITRNLKSAVGGKKTKENDFLVLITKGYEESLHELQAQTQALKDSFKTLQEELIQMAQARKDLFVFFLSFYKQCQLKRYGPADPEEEKEIEIEFKKVTDSLFNVPFSTHLDEIGKHFRENLGKLRLYLDKMDVLSKTESLGKENADNNLVHSLKKILNSYGAIAKSQNNTIKAIYAPFIGESTGNPLATFKTVSQEELDRMWEVINGKKKFLETSQKILVSKL
eukprot:TRINITY_DN9417_c0_g1_i8.p2 TRINITY_DN9417_c0_g1~~TRINITY_DN9417_c0_g1_i8.p2  ORF type:complete len:455 (+),score=60.42 TRINITY_DN9417_c0_g1_i8:6057-7421(+)